MIHTEEEKLPVESKERSILKIINAFLMKHFYRRSEQNVFKFKFSTISEPLFQNIFYYNSPVLKISQLGLNHFGDLVDWKLCNSA